MAKAKIINKLRFFKMGQDAPKNSNFIGKITPETIFGTLGGYFSYSTRYTREESNSLFDYTNTWNGIDLNNTMSSQGMLNNQDDRELFRKHCLDSMKDNSIVYELILSIDSFDTAHKASLDDQNDFAAVVTKIMPTYIQNIGFDYKNITWWEDFHPTNETSTTPHPHMHILFFENVPSGKYDDHYGKLPKKATTELKRLFAREMIERMSDEDISNLFSNFNITRNQLKERIKGIRFDRVNNIKELYAILPSKGRLQFNSVHMIPYRKTIMDVVDYLLNSKDVRKDWNEYLDALNKYDDIVNDLNGTNISTLGEQEIGKFKIEIANMILKYKKTYDNDCLYEKVLKIEDAEGDFKENAVYKNRHIVRNKLSVREDRSINRFKKGLKSSINARQRDVEDEIYKYLNNIDKVY